MMSTTVSELQAIRATVAQDLQWVDEELQASLTSDIPLMQAVALHLMKSGGKRLRPLVVVLCAKALNYEGQNHAVLATVIEFIHAATLLHDDVVDESTLRRGKPTANALYGNQASVLVGDFLYSRSFQRMVQLNDSRIMQVLADTTNIIAGGEILQLENCQFQQIDETRYIQTITAKTAMLFSAAAETAALLADSPFATRQAFKQFGIDLGIAFQLIDDMLDYIGDEHEIGKHIGDDFFEGKPTLPIIHLLQTASKQDLPILQRHFTERSTASFHYIQDAIATSDAIPYTYRLATEYAEHAKKQLAHLSINQYTDALMRLCDFALTRCV